MERYRALTIFNLTAVKYKISHGETVREKGCGYSYERECDENTFLVDFVTDTRADGIP
jgi:hypothetical protein